MPVINGWDASDVLYTASRHSRWRRGRNDTFPFEAFKVLPYDSYSTSPLVTSVSVRSYKIRPHHLNYNLYTSMRLQTA